MDTKILRVPEVLAAVGISRTTLWRRIKSGEFPPPVRLGGASAKIIGWRRADVERWIEELEAVA